MAAAGAPAPPDRAAADSLAAPRPSSGGPRPQHRRADLLFERAHQQLRAGRHDSAASSLVALITLDPHEGRAYRALVHTYHVRQQLWEGYRLIEGLQRRYARLAEPLVALGEIELLRERPQPAVLLFEKAVTRQPHDPAALGGLARSRARAGEGKDALAYFDKLLLAAPALAAFRYGKAVVLAEQGDGRAAAGQFKWAIHLDRTNWRAERDYGRLLAAEGDDALALEHLGRAVEILDGMRDTVTAAQLRAEIAELQGGAPDGG